MCTLYRLTVHVVRKLFEEYDTSAAQRMLSSLPEGAVDRSALVTQCYSMLCAARGESFAFLVVGQTKLHQRRYSIFTHQRKSLDAIAKHRKSSRRFCT